MEEQELQKERQNLNEVNTKLEDEQKNIEEILKASSKAYKKSDVIRAQLMYLSEKRLKDIEGIKNKPYFARLDFKENGKNKEEFYIGKLSVLDSKTKQPVVIDWRTPVANLYYNGRIGNAKYECLDGTINGEILLKRQYFIENKKLEKYVDIDVTGNDELLQEAISEKADDRLKNIVATIQEEQNKIIRAGMNKPLIVQGVAGSGKTTIALHRIAYLIYNYEKEFNPEDFMIIAPNRFFLNYISNILPDLGVDDVRQYTFEDFAYEVIGKKLKISDNNEKLVTIVNKEFDNINKGNIDIMIQESKYKSSMKYKEKVDEFLKSIEENFIPKKDFTIENIVIVKYEELNNLFLNTYKIYDYNRRIFEMKKNISSTLKNKSEEICNNIRQIRSRRIRELETLELNIDEEQKRRIKIFEEYEDILKKLEKGQKKLIDEFFNQIPKKDCITYYKEFIQNLEENSGLIEYLKKNTLTILNKKEISFEDLAPIIYIQYKIYGAKFTGNLRHIVIDEAQDYGEFQFSIMKTILKSSSMTILGDLAQGVYYYRGIENWKDFIEKEFPDENVQYSTLEKTYRTTKEIMDLANQVINKLPEYEKEYIVLGEPVIYGKNSIYMRKSENEKETIKNINNRIEKHLKDGYKSIAIIGKDREECEFIKKELLKYRKDVTLIQSKDSEYHAGISIVPSYLAKGLEFDVVIISNANDKKYVENSLDIKLLYVTITRAMSKLDIFYTENLSKCLKME